MIVTEPMLVDTPTGFPPEFRQLFADRKAILGSIVQFEARLSGTPPLNVNFEKQNKTFNNRIIFVSGHLAFQRCSDQFYFRSSTTTCFR